MSIQDFAGKIKGMVVKNRPNFHIIPDDLFLGLIIILVAFGAFGLGRLSKIEGSKVPIRVVNAPEITPETFRGAIVPETKSPAFTQSVNAGDGELVGSKTGKKYYYPWCSGIQKISSENLIHFASKADAEARGYTPSATCKGL